MELKKNQSVVDLHFSLKKYYDADEIIGQKLFYVDIKSFDCKTIDEEYQASSGMLVIGEADKVKALLTCIHAELSEWKDLIKKYIDEIPEFTDLDEINDYLWENYTRLGGGDYFGVCFEYGDIELIKKQIASAELWLCDLFEIIQNIEA